MDESSDPEVSQGYKDRLAGAFRDGLSVCVFHRAKPFRRGAKPFSALGPVDLPYKPSA
jgi:hypothetical protein